MKAGAMADTTDSVKLLNMWRTPASAFLRLLIKSD